MPEYFKGWWRKAGRVVFVLACVCAVCIGLWNQIGDEVIVINRSSTTIDLVKVAVVRAANPADVVHPIGSGTVIVGNTKIPPLAQVSNPVPSFGKGEFNLYTTTSKGVYYSGELEPLPWGNRIHLEFPHTGAPSIRCDESSLRKFVDERLRPVTQFGRSRPKIENDSADPIPAKER
jgi:hypothetical protein